MPATNSTDGADFVMLKPQDPESYFSEMNGLTFVNSWGAWRGG